MFIIDDGQGGLACCSPWGHEELDMTEQLNWCLLYCWKHLCCLPFVLILINKLKWELNRLPEIGMGRGHAWSLGTVRLSFLPSWLPFFGVLLLNVAPICWAPTTEKAPCWVQPHGSFCELKNLRRKHQTLLYESVSCNVDLQGRGGGDVICLLPFLSH